MANKPRTPNNNVLVVDTGVPVNVNGIPAIVLRRETETLQELKQGRYALAPRQAGFARQEECLLYKDEKGNYHYLYSSEALKEQLYVKEPVATPEYLPGTDAVGVLRYVHSEDQYYMLMEKEDGSKEWVPVTAHADERLDEEIARAIARENEIERNAQGIGVADNGNGSFTFTDYGGEESVVPTGKKVQSSDGTVEVAESAAAFDLSIQPEIDRATDRENQIEGKAQGISVTDNQDGTFSFTDYNGETEAINPNPDLLVASDSMATEATPTSLSITGTWTNLRSQLKTLLALNIPAATDGQTGVMTGEDHAALTDAIAQLVELWAIVRAGTGRVVIAQLPDNPAQQDITAAFNFVYPGTIFDSDVVIDVSHGGLQWMYSNGEWIDFGEHPIPMATNTTLGLVQGDPSGTAGKIYVEYDGTQSVIGWDDLTTAAGNIASKINASYAYGASVQGSTLTVNLRNIFTGSETAAEVALPNAFTGVSYSGNTLTFNKADGSTHSQDIALAIGNVTGRGTLTVQGNGTAIGSYDASSDETVNITAASIGAASAEQGAKADTALQEIAAGDGISVSGTGTSRTVTNAKPNIQSDWNATSAEDGAILNKPSSLPSAPSGPAGGDLAGAYPNPSISSQGINRAFLSRSLGAANANNITDGGWLYVTTGSTNLPPGQSYGWILSFLYNSLESPTWRRQMFFQEQGGTNNGIWYRDQYNGELWSSWRKLAIASGTASQFVRGDGSVDNGQNTNSVMVKSDVNRNSYWKLGTFLGLRPNADNASIVSVRCVYGNRESWNRAWYLRNIMVDVVRNDSWRDVATTHLREAQGYSTADGASLRCMWSMYFTVSNELWVAIKSPRYSWVQGLFTVDSPYFQRAALVATETTSPPSDIQLSIEL